MALLDILNKEIIQDHDSPGELLIKSTGMFDRYLNKHTETKNSFYNDWFKTGDFA